MRITSGRMIDLSAAAVAKQQRAVADASTEVSSGMRVERPSQDPTAWVAAQRAGMRRTVLAGDTASVESAKERLAQTDAAFATIGDAVTRAWTLAIQGASAGYSAADRAGMAAELRELMGSALAAANARGADGEFLLGGSLSTSTPFDAAGGYLGDAATREVRTSEATTTVASVAGSALTAASGVDVLPLFEAVAARLAANDPAGAQALLGDFERASAQVASARSTTGHALAALEDVAVAHGLLNEQFSASIARAVESDTVAAASTLARSSHALEISRAVSAHVVALVDPSR
jgi:flagellin-like hook-associated protein FlgL